MELGNKNCPKGFTLVLRVLMGTPTDSGLMNLFYIKHHY